VARDQLSSAVAGDTGGGAGVVGAVASLAWGVAGEWVVAAGLGAGSFCSLAAMLEPVLDGALAEVFAEELDTGLFDELVDLNR
jgi:hypothetical protein